MKKIITAINNPKLNQELAKENNFEVICKDIQYREAILEILEKNKNIDIIIISEQILGEINFENLIKKIKLINEKIKIIFILEKENNYLETILIKNNINEIYYNSEINLFELIKIIKKKEINMEEEIIKLKKIIIEKDNNYNKLKNDFLEKNKSVHKLNIFKYKRRKKLKKETKIKEKKNNKKKIMLSKIITFSGDYKTGKTTLSLIISQYLANQDYKVLLVDGDLKKQDMSFILKEETKIKKNNNFFLYQIYKIKKVTNLKEKIKINKFKIFKIKKRYYEKINIYKNIKKINKNFCLFDGLNNFLEKNKIKNKNEIKKKTTQLFDIVLNKFDFIIFDLSKENNEFLNREILKNGYKNFILMEGNMLGIKEIGKTLNLYLKKWKIDKKSLHIIENKSNIFSINVSLLSKVIPIQNKILKFKEIKKFLILMNNYHERNILLKNPIIKKDINKIIKIINN